MKRIRGFDDRFFFRDKSGGEFRRLVGGLAWPHADLAGWLVVLGEERNTRLSDGRRHIDIVHVWQARAKQGQILSPREIMDEARALSISLLCQCWVSPTDLPDAALLAMYNRELGKHDHKLSLRTPPQYGRNAFLLYDRLLERRTMQEKTLHMRYTGEGLGDNQALEDEYAILQPDDRLRPLEEYPAVAALLYALAWLEFTPASGVGTEKQVKAVGKGGY